jgi:MerR family transcriptional regulator/heat shock protein HspR
MGVNLAGIEIIYNMKLKMEKMQEEFAKFLEELKKEFFTGKENLFEQKKQTALVKFSPSTVALLKNEKT